MALDATLDIATVRDHLAAIPAICAGGEQAGPIGQLSQRERFRWLVAHHSTVIQISPVHTGCCRTQPPCLSTAEHDGATVARGSCGSVVGAKQPSWSLLCS